MYEKINDEVLQEIINCCETETGSGGLNRLEVPQYRLIGTGYVAHVIVLPYLQKVLDFEVREDDIWLLGPIRCGTTMSQEMVWLIKNNFDFEKAKRTHIERRFPIMDTPPHCLSFKDVDLNLLESPRMFKSHAQKPHLPKQLWTKKPKIIYICRNPKDMAVSVYYFYKLMFHYNGPMNLILKAFVEDKILSTPYWTHVLSMWKMRNEKNVLFLRYEDIVQDMPMTINKIANFLGVDYTKEQENDLIDHLNIQKMRHSEAVNVVKDVYELNEKEHYIRKGGVGGWRKEMTLEEIKMFDDWIEKSLEGSDFPRTYL